MGVPRLAWGLLQCGAYLPLRLSGGPPGAGGGLGRQCAGSLNSHSMRVGGLGGAWGPHECAINELSSPENNSPFVSPAPPQLLPVPIALPQPQNTRLCLRPQLVMQEKLPPAPAGLRPRA